MGTQITNHLSNHQPLSYDQIFTFSQIFPRGHYIVRQGSFALPICEEIGLAVGVQR
jgi:hypothetical protein